MREDGSQAALNKGLNTERVSQVVTFAKEVKKCLGIWQLPFSFIFYCRTETDVFGTVWPW